MKLLEWIGVQLLDLSAWSNRLAVLCIVRARPIPPPPRLPRIEMPDDVPRIDIGLDDDERTVTDRPAGISCAEPRLLLMSCDDGGSRVHADQWVRFEGTA